MEVMQNVAQNDRMSSLSYVILHTKLKLLYKKNILREEKKLSLIPVISQNNHLARKQEKQPTTLKKSVTILWITIFCICICLQILS